ncbi:MAG TPA: response regulator [Gemmatimonadales bacterium]|nr:response regulator [Gemmatimonadales bacterium]
MATTLLLVEDDDFVRHALTRALTRTGVFTVVPAEHGEQALQIFDERHVDAILTDLQMPVMDGLTLLGHLLERGSRVPVAVMTGQRITAELAQRLHSFGIAATFAKPVDIATLADELQRAMTPATVGRITGITLFGFLQLIEVERKTGLIVVHAGDQEGRLYFDRGQLVHAHTRRLDGLPALHEIVAWPDPKLEIFYKRKSRERTIKEPLQHVLMEAARVLDERGVTLGDAAEDGADATQPDVQDALDEAMDIDGALGVALIDSTSGVVLGTAGGSAKLNVEVAGAGAADFVRAEARALAAAGVKDTIEDVMITLGKQYHLVRFLGPDVHALLYLVLDRERSNLGMARHTLAAIGRRITV